MFCPECGKELIGGTNEIVVSIDDDGFTVYDIWCSKCNASGEYSPDIIEEVEE